jgi:ABC-type sugar transport system ATPase subunit
LPIKADKIELFKNLLDSTKIMVMTGPSGCGKTSLL